nr:serine hydrolase [Desulfocapsaceae bacterium]
LYSDLDYLLLGYLVENISGMELARYWQEKIAGPLKVEDKFYFMGDKKTNLQKVSFAVTGKCSWTGSILAGLVHDDNCRAIGRISGHAGLFGTLAGVLDICESILLKYIGEKQHPSYNREDLLYLLKRRKREQWACGFDVPTGENPSCGQCFSKKTIGHLGFTGTSFWIDLIERKIAVVLTNRVIYGSNNETIKDLRPKLHDVLFSTR